MTDIRSQAREEASAESQLARRMEFAGEENRMNLGIKGQEASNVEVNNRRAAITNQYTAQRELQLAQLGITDQAARDQLALEAKALDFNFARGGAEYNASIEKFVQQGALLRFRDLEFQSQRTLDKSILSAISRPMEEAFKEWRIENSEATPEQSANYLRSILGQFITLPLIEAQEAQEAQIDTASASNSGLRIVRAG
tara:strand:- start:1200 stop:1793 length:594 start_codon:yes stop_codon:yes gene_type:complete